MKRLLAMLLCVVMVVGLIPASVFAAEEDVDYLFLATDRHTNTSIIATMINNMEANIGENELDYLGLGGDMVGSSNSHPSYNSSTVLGEVTGATSSLNATNVDIVAGIHDMNVNDDAGIVLPYQGGGAQIYEGDKYYVYGVEEYCVSNASNASTEAQAFVDWANGEDIDKSKVIIVLSHYPLHQRRNDNNGASYWATALNTVAAGDDATIDRDVAFFWGHNHTGETSADTAVYHVAPGKSISVQGGSSSQTIYFTYANAGYLNSHSSATLVSITDTTITFEKYKNSSISTTNTVTRVVNEPEVTLSSIAISGTTQYSVGDELALTVTATYSDGSTADVTADATLSGYDMSVGGVYTVTATYEDKTATATVTVNPMTVTCDATFVDESGATQTNGDTVTATGNNLTGITAQWKDMDLSAIYGDASPNVYDVALEGYTEGETVEITMDLLYMEADGLQLYYVNADGTTEAITPTNVESVETEDYYSVIVTFTTDKVGTFAVGVPEITVADGADLVSLTITTAPETCKYFVEETNTDGILPLDITGLVVTAAYSDGTQKEIQWNNFGTIADAYALTFDMTVLGNQDVIVSYTYTGTEEVTKTVTFPIWIGSETFTTSDEDGNTVVSVTVSNPGTTQINVTDEITDEAAAAVAYEVTNYTVYNITLESIDGNGLDGGTATVTLPIPEGVTNPKVFYVSDNGKVVTDMNATVNDNGTVTFETDHFSTYVLGDGTTIDTESGNATTEGTEDVTTTTKVAEEVTVYKLVTSPESGKTYLIVNSNTGTGYGLDGDTTGYATTAFTGGSDYYSTWDDTNKTGTAFTAGSDVYLTTTGAYLWTAGNNTFSIGYDQDSNGSFLNGYTYTYTLNPAGSGDNWTLSDSKLSITLDASASGIFGGSNSDATYYLTNNDSTWGMNTSDSANVYFYEPVTIYKVTEQETTIPGTEGGTYTAAGTDITNAIALSGQTVELISTLTFTTTSGTSSTPTGWTATYEVVEGKGNPNVISSISGSTATLSGTAGTAVVKVTYTNGTLTAWAEFIVTAVAPETFDVQITKDGTVVGDDETLTQKNVTSTSTMQLGANVTFATSDGVTGDVTNPTLVWSIPSTQQSIATVNASTGLVSFKGIGGTVEVTVSYQLPNGNYATDKVIISVTTTDVTVPNDGTDDFPDYPNEGAVRHDKTATAVGNFSETGIAKIELSMTGVPFTTGSEIDVVVMLDMTGSMSDNGITAAEEAAKAFIETIVKNTDGTYNNNRVAVYQFNSNGVTTFFNLQTISSDTELTTAQNKINGSQASGGTPFDTAAKHCHDILAAAKTDGTGNNRQQFCVFMSDGGPTTYEGSDGYTYYGGNASGDRKITNYIGGYTSSTSSSWTYNLPTEYWTDDMKADGVTVYTVGLLLQNVPSNPSPYSSMTSSTYDSTTDTLTTIGSHYYFTSTILKNMATDTSKYIDIFSVANADKATAAFESIAKDILAAATDVTVADKIGDNYTMVFDAPNATVDSADGGQDYYIEVTDYELVPVYTQATGITAFATGVTYYTKNSDGTYSEVSGSFNASTTYYTITDYTRGTSTSLLKLYLGYNETTGYFAATDNAGTKAATPTFATTTLGDKGTKYYWTTDSAKGDSGISVVGADNTTYYFVSTGDGTHNMTAGAYASGTKTTVTKTTSDGNTVTSSTCQDMIIATPYFVYNAQTKMLVWTIDKLMSSELTLTYFLYLNNSGGFTGTDAEITPATYKTNQFAYLNYTNFQGTDCQLTFPVPQMTWNGAQVSYVFYLVNEAGLPVNRAGRVVPFSEAVYVTDVYTYSIIWNDLEQTAGLDAVRLAEELVPDVYELYDNGATYNIHVYEDYTKSNLNNHFVIGSSVTNSVYTTYVFNTKSDAVKYNIPGAYVADNGTAPTYQSNQTYWCKSYDVTGEFTKTLNTDSATGIQYYTYTVTSAAYSGSETRVPASQMTYTTGGTKIADTDGVEYVYYVDEEEKIYTIVTKSDGTEVEAGFDFSNTTVAFAVLWKPRLETDTVVIDFGLDVVIDVSKNDSLAGSVVGVMDSAPDANINEGTYSASVGTSSVDVCLTGTTTKIGTATRESGSSVRFSLDKDVGMQMNKAGLFYYESAVNYYDDDGELVSTHMYSSVIVIPASTVYYEDEYVELKTVAKNDAGTWETTDGWQTNSQAVGSHITQAVDRPGQDMISATYDANNAYGYDKAYDNMSTYSMGSAASINVTSTKRGEAYFTFYGTGFDVIGLTSNTTGTLIIQVFKGASATGTAEKTTMVDTYYGYVKNAEGKWVTSDNDPNAVYQVPVMKVSGLTYGQYTVKIIAGYNASFDHNTTESGYDLYLDAIRIYDPVAAGTVVGKDAENDGNDVTIEEIYDEDNEGWPSYTELRNNVIAASNCTVTKNEDASLTVTFDSELTEGAIFIDCKDEALIADYVSYGPNNELYLDTEQAIAFNTASGTGIADVQIGLKVANGDTVTYKINGDSYTINTATDMYYSIKDYCSGTVIIENVSGGILSITNIKVTYESDPGAAAATSLLWMDGESAGYALMSLRAAPAPEVTEPEATEPEATEPEATEPEATEPEATEPEATEPEATEPEATEPEATEPEATEPEATEPEATEPEATEPEATEPEATEPEATEPEATEPEATEPEATEPEATEPEATEPEAEESVTQKIVNALKNLFNWLFSWL